MMGDIVLTVHDLRKEFILNHSGAASLKSALLWWKKRNLERFEVLKGLTFEIRSGECVAILGRNGAGKSTLLSLIAQIYRPTSGTVQVNGRVAPLLELGAGFHPDLTGIENVYFNASILGLKRKEIDERLADIIAFAEIEHHMDTPVRTYSSGMLSRLGFAIAMHVEADILLVDEVLAVGDFDFRNKCKKKIQEFKKAGGTIIFVSHSAADIKEIADRCIWIQHGKIQMMGPGTEVFPCYETGSSSELS